MGRSSKPCVSVLSHPFGQIKRFLGQAEPTDNEDVDEEDDDDEPIEFSYGLIIGQFTKGGVDQSKNELPVVHVVYLARTPVEVKDDENGEDETEEEVESLDQVDPDWVMEHAKRVSVMLPGGIHVLGVYVCDNQTSDVVLKSGKIDKCLRRIDSVINASKKSVNYLSIHIDRNSKSYSCNIVAFEDGAPTAKGAKSAEIEEASADFRWQIIKSKFLFDYPIIFKAGEDSDQPIVRKVKTALNMVEKNLESANILFENTFRSKEDELLDEKLIAKLNVSKRSNPKSSKNDEGDDDDDEEDSKAKEYIAEILLDPQFQSPPDDVEVVEVSSRMRLSGRMAIRAYLHPRATVGEATQAVKEDLLRSLNARCDMHCDSLVGEEMGGASDDIPVLHEPPRRVLIKLPESEVTISDFLFPGESTEASAKAIEEMFGFFPELEDLDDEQELVASPKQVVSGDGEDKASASTASTILPTGTSGRVSSPFSPLSILLSLVVAGLGVAFSYFYSFGASDDEIDIGPETVKPSGRRQE